MDSTTPDTAGMAPVKETTALVAMDPATLTEMRLAEARELATKIDAKDAQSVMAFGTKPQSTLASATEQIIGTTRSVAAGDAGETLTELLATLRSADMHSFSGAIDRFMAKLPIVGGFFSATKQLIQAYEPIANKISKIEARLHGQQLTLLTDYENLNRLFEDNIDFLELLEVYIAAGKFKVEDLKAEQTALKTSANSADPMQAQAIDDSRRAIERLSQRLYDLEVTRQVALQTGPQIRLIQDGNEKLANKIHTAVLTTIPLWKSQIAMAINLANQKSALEGLTAVTDATNELLVQNSELLKTSTVEIQRQTQRGVVDIETLQRTTDNLIATVQEALAVSEEGRLKREEGERALVALEAKLKNAIVASQKGPMQGF